MQKVHNESPWSGVCEINDDELKSHVYRFMVRLEMRSDERTFSVCATLYARSLFTNMELGKLRFVVCLRLNLSLRGKWEIGRGSQGMTLRI